MRLFCFGVFVVIDAVFVVVDVVLFCCFFVLDVYIVFLVTFYVALRLILIEVEFWWMVVGDVGWVCKVIIMSNSTQLS